MREIGSPVRAADKDTELAYTRHSNFNELPNSLPTESAAYQRHNKCKLVTTL